LQERDRYGAEGQSNRVGAADSHTPWCARLPANGVAARKHIGFGAL